MLSKKEAYEILGVNNKSLESDIETRYSTLVKRYRAEQDNEKLEQVSLAYNIITGRYVEPVKVDPKMQNVVFGKTRSEWGNIWLYGKVKYFVITLIVIFVGYMIYTIVTNTPADFKIAAVGEFSVPDSNITQAYIKTLFPQFKKVEIATAYLSETGGAAEYGAANAQKAMILMTVSGEDVIIVDRATFDRYASMGTFKPIGDLYNAIHAMDETKDLSLESVKTTISTESGGTGIEDIYGIDVSNTQLLNATGIYGRDQIITISIKTEQDALAREFINKLFKDSPRLIPQITWIPSPMPTPTPTLALTPAISPASK